MTTRVLIPYRELGQILKLNSNKIEHLISHVKTKFNLNPDELKHTLTKIRSFHESFNKKLVKCCSSYEALIRDPWMRGKMEIVLKEKDNLKRKAGRPTKKFEDCTARTKRRKVQELCAVVPKSQIESAAVRTIKKPVAKIVRNLIHSTASEFKEYRDKAARVDIIPLNETEAVSLLIDLNLGKHQYQTIQGLAKSRNADIFPPYNKMLAAKKQCYPDPASIEVDEVSASIKLQALLDHTSERLLLTLEDQEISKLPANLLLLSKYGCDGASGQSRYKQSFKACTEDEADDSRVFMCSLVPLRIVEETDSKMVHWQNVRAGSPRFCRPIKYMFAGEYKERTVKEVGDIKQQISELTASVVSIGEKRFLVRHRLFFSMIDGKTCSYVTDTDSSTTCAICKATPNEINDLKKLAQKPVDESFYEFGLSPLHAKIRFMEFVLHLGYNMDFEEWTASVKKGHAEIKKTTKDRIQTEFWNKLNLLVDIVKQGSGTTNDGNTARRFFANPETVAEITKVDVNIIKRLAIILQTLSCGRDIDALKFGVYAMDTYSMIIEKYVWYKVPWSVHRIPKHGEQTIIHNILPIGMLTEEAAEARNKDFRRYREHHSRKFNRTVSNQDILNFLLISSDPLISSMRPVMKKKELELDDEAKALLLFDEFNNRGDNVDDN